MSQTTTNTTAGELVPIADRLRYMLRFRIFVALGVGASTLLAWKHLYVPAELIGAGTAAFLVLSVLTHTAWNVSRRGGVALFGFMVMVDGAYLAAVAETTHPRVVLDAAGPVLRPR